MTTEEKLLERLKSRPKDFSFEEAVKALSSIGMSEVAAGRTSGSRAKFASEDGRKLTLHRPHGGQALKAYVVDELVALVEEHEAGGSDVEGEE